MAMDHHRHTDREQVIVSGSVFASRYRICLCTGATILGATPSHACGGCRPGAQPEGGWMMARTRGHDESSDGGQGSGPSSLVWITLVWSVHIHQAPWSYQVESIVRASAESEAFTIDWFSHHTALGSPACTNSLLYWRITIANHGCVLPRSSTSVSGK